MPPNAVSPRPASWPSGSSRSSGATPLLRRFSTPSPYTGGNIVAEPGHSREQPAVDPTNKLQDQVIDASSAPADTVHQYNLKSRGRIYALITVKSHAPNARDPPLLYFGEELTGFVILSLNDLSGMQSMDVMLRMFDSDPILPTFETRRALLSQQVDGSYISGGRFCWPFTIAPPVPSSSTSSSVVDSSLGNRSPSSMSHNNGGGPKFQLIVTIHRRGRLTRNVGVRQILSYVSPPDPSARVPSTQSPILADLLHGSSVELIMATTKSSFPVNDTIPLHLTLTSKSREALDLLGVSHVIDVRLQKVLAFGKQASVIRPLTLKNRSSYHRTDMAAKAHWDFDGHAKELPSNDGHPRPRWCINLNGKFHRQPRVELSPSFEVPGMALMYFVSLFPFRSKDFRPASDPNKELVMGKIQLTNWR
ncbi:hypothetical protein BC826DRAFT_1102149 [Russula brevipes]|nr:hypothetical protein BC826DRAFT_1102149 [Russula brevipes]